MISINDICLWLKKQSCFQAAWSVGRTLYQVPEKILYRAECRLAIDVLPTKSFLIPRSNRDVLAISAGDENQNEFSRSKRCKLSDTSTKRVMHTSTVFVKDTGWRPVFYWYVAFGNHDKIAIRAGSSSSPQRLSAMNAACNSYSNVTRLVSYWPPWTAEEGDVSSFFCCWGPRDGASGEMRPDKPRAFENVNNSQLFP